MQNAAVVLHHLLRKVTGAVRLSHYLDVPAYGLIVALYHLSATHTWSAMDVSVLVASCHVAGAFKLVSAKYLKETLICVILSFSAYSTFSSVRTTLFCAPCATDMFGKSSFR